MTTINQKDADQDQLIALLTHRIEDAEKMSEELRDRVRNLERWVWRAGAVITAAVTLVGIIVAIPEDADAFTEDSLTGTPCATELVSNYVEEVSVKPSLEEKE
tara:strand:+ start:141 stop:449 length:309 start_codon:yes stop_codon:yes gene_type:complete